MTQAERDRQAAEAAACRIPRCLSGGAHHARGAVGPHLARLRPWTSLSFGPTRSKRHVYPAPDMAAPPSVRATASGGSGSSVASSRSSSPVGFSSPRRRPAQFFRRSEARQPRQDRERREARTRRARGRARRTSHRSSRSKDKSRGNNEQYFSLFHSGSWSSTLPAARPPRRRARAGSALLPATRTGRRRRGLPGSPPRPRRFGRRSSSPRSR